MQHVWARKALIFSLFVIGAAATAAAMVPWSTATPKFFVRHAAASAAVVDSATLRLSPDDTYLNIDAVNYSTAPILATYTWPDAKVANAVVMKFDLSSVPAGATIEQATLHLSLIQSDGAADTYAVSAHKITGKAPVIGQATGLNASTKTPWTASTCCSNNAPLAQADISSPYDTQMVDTTPGDKVWNLTRLVQEWQTTPAANLGLLLNADAAKPRDRYRFFASMENGDTKLRPYLDVTYSAADVTPPSVKITAPTSGTVTGSVDVAATATDNTGVAAVRLLLDGRPIGQELTSAPYGQSLDTTSVADGVHTLSATARDSAGNVGASAGVNISVLNGIIVVSPQDTYLNVDAQTHGDEQLLSVYTWPDNKPANAILMKFDLSSVPAGATITDATLNLALVESDPAAGTYDVRAHKVTGLNPVTSKATGLSADGTTNWTANPCCANSAPLAQADISTPYDTQTVTNTAGWKTWNLTAMVQEWLRDPASNDGVLLNADVQKPRDRYRTFASTRARDAEQRPFLRLKYTLPETTTPAADTTSTTSSTTSSTTDATASATTSNSERSVQAPAPSSDDTILPSVTITAPSPRLTVSGTTSLRANATDNVGVAGVQFTVDGLNVGAEDTTAPYAVSWNSGEVANGSHTLHAIARDHAGNVRTSTGLVIKTSNDRTPPSVRVTSPASGAAISGTVALKAVATDNVGVRAVQFFVDGVSVGEDTSSPYSVNWSSATAAEGDHVITATARDAAGNVGTAGAVSVSTSDTPPPPPPPADTTAPIISGVGVSGVTTSGATVSWTTNETSNTQAEYGLSATYGNMSNLGTALVMSHSSALGGLNAGTTYHVRVRSRDAAGNLGTSADVSFTTSTTPPPPPPPSGGTGGIASQFPGDVNIESHPDVVFVERFDEASTSALFTRWNDVLNGPSMSLGTDAPAGGNGKSLTIPWQGGGVNNGGHLFRNLSQAVTDTLYIRYYIKYPTSGQYQHSGIWTGGHNPAITWPDPQAGLKPAGNDRFSAAAEQDAATGKFDHYDYWMGMRQSVDGNYWGNNLLNNPAVSVTGGQWMCVEQMVKLNNPVSSANGEHAIWLNGTKVSDVGPGFPNGTWSGGNFIQSTSGSAFPGLQWRNDSNLNINWLWLQVYAPRDPSGFQGQMKFAQVVAAKSYIGCMGSAAPPPPVLDTTPPSVSVSAPAEGATVSGSVSITASASDNVGVSGVQFQVDGATLGAEKTSSPYSASWTTTSVANGTHTLTALARDAAGNIMLSATRTVTVSNNTGGGGGGGGTGNVIFESNWDTATGGGNAPADGGRWPNYWEFNGNNPSVTLMSVVSGGPNGHNALRVQQRGSTFAANVQKDNVLPQSTDYYLRFYMKNDDTSGSGDHIVTVDTYQYPNLTFIRKSSSASGWQITSSLYGCGYTYPIGHWSPAMTLQHGQWYRFEYFVHFVDATHIQLHPRVYDENENLILSDADFKQSDYGGQVWNGRSDWTFASYYAAGNSFCVDPQWVNDIGLGNNGQQGASDTGQYWYFAALQVRTDGWAGPVAPKAPAPSPAPAPQEVPLALASVGGWEFIRRRRSSVR